MVRWIALLAIAVVLGACGKKPVSDAGPASPAEKSVPAIPPSLDSFEAYVQEQIAFRQRNIAKTGQKVTATGRFKLGKPGAFVPFDGGELYVRATRESDYPRDEDLTKRFLKRIVTVTGTLRHCDTCITFESVLKAFHSGDESPVAMPIEYFFLDAGEVEMVEAASAESAPLKVKVEQLLDTPEKFAGKQVDVTGYYRADGEDSSLLADAAIARQRWSSANAIWLEPDIWGPGPRLPNVSDPDDLKSHTVRVVGTFAYRKISAADGRAHQREVTGYGYFNGIRGGWAHAINDITYLRPER